MLNRSNPKSGLPVLWPRQPRFIDCHGNEVLCDNFDGAPVFVANSVHALQNMSKLGETGKARRNEGHADGRA